MKISPFFRVWSTNWQAPAAYISPTQPEQRQQIQQTTNSCEKTASTVEVAKCCALTTAKRDQTKDSMDVLFSTGEFRMVVHFGHHIIFSASQPASQRQAAERASKREKAQQQNKPVQKVVCGLITETIRRPVKVPRSGFAPCSWKLQTSVPQKVKRSRERGREGGSDRERQRAKRIGKQERAAFEL